LEDEVLTSGSGGLSGPLVMVAAMLIGCGVRGERAPALAPSGDEFPGMDAIVSRFVVPGLDEGFVPQGLCLAGDSVVLAGYQSDNPLVSIGPCRLYVLAPVTGEVVRRVALPASCIHAGGLAYDGERFLYVSDTRHVFVVDLPRTLESPAAAVVAEVPLTDGVRGSFVALHDDALLVGRYAGRDSERPLYVFSAAAVRGMHGRSLRPADASRSLIVPPHTQGATFAADGSLWLSRGNLKYGRLSRIDPQSGALLAEYHLPAGLEGIAVTAHGGLWAVSELGARRFRGTARPFPFVFLVDLGRLIGPVPL
jgi:hypothetical protein